MCMSVRGGRVDGMVREEEERSVMVCEGRVKSAC